MFYSKAALQRGNFEYYKRAIDGVKIKAYLHDYLDKLNYEVKETGKLDNLTKEQKGTLLGLIRKKKTQMEKGVKK